MILQTVVIVLFASVILWAALRWIAATPSVLVDVEACRGSWAEARIRGCDHGIAFTGIPIEPINVYSSTAYLAAGWVTSRTLPGATPYIFGGAMLLLAFGSGLYHGCKAMWAARLDHAGMYAGFAALAFYAMAPEHTLIPWFMGGAALTAAVIFAFVYPGNLTLRMGLLLSLVSVRAFLLGTLWLGAVSLGVFAVAMACWQIDQRTKLLGRWGHGIWHLLTATAMATMFVGLT